MRSEASIGYSDFPSPLFLKSLSLVPSRGSRNALHECVALCRSRKVVEQWLNRSPCGNSKSERVFIGVFVVVVFIKVNLLKKISYLMQRRK